MLMEILYFLECTKKPKYFQHLVALGVIFLIAQSQTESLLVLQWICRTAIDHNCELMNLL